MPKGVEFLTTGFKIMFILQMLFCILIFSFDDLILATEEDYNVFFFRLLKCL